MDETRDTTVDLAPIIAVNTAPPRPVPTPKPQPKVEAPKPVPAKVPAKTPVPASLVIDTKTFLTVLYYAWRMCRQYEEKGSSPRTVAFVLYSHLSMLFESGDLDHFAINVQRSLDIAKATPPTTVVRRPRR